MGYYTNFSLNVHGGDIPYDVHEKQIGDEFYEGFNPFSESCKWYDCDKDMLEYSKKYPDVLFIVDGDGEESGDVWRTYYKNGKAQSANMRFIYDEFDETKLK